MPPQQCPECGRFLKNALVERLEAAPAPCPKCGIELTAAHFAEAGVADADHGPALAPAAPPPASSAGTSDLPVAAPAAGTSLQGSQVSGAASVRPPDLLPDQVRDAHDPLAGWDAGVPLPEVRDRRPFPTDTVVVVAGAVAGTVAGTMLTERRTAGGLLGAVTGAGLAGALRQIWRLPEA